MGPPEGVLPAAGAHAAGLPTLKDATAEMVAQHTGVLPPMGGAQLSPSDVRALAAYIAALKQGANAERFAINMLHAR